MPTFAAQKISSSLKLPRHPRWKALDVSELWKWVTLAFPPLLKLAASNSKETTTGSLLERCVICMGERASCGLGKHRVRKESPEVCSEQPHSHLHLLYIWPLTQESYKALHRLWQMQMSSSSVRKDKLHQSLAEDAAMNLGSSTRRNSKHTPEIQRAAMPLLRASLRCGIRTSSSRCQLPWLFSLKLTRIPE